MAGADAGSRLCARALVRGRSDEPKHGRRLGNRARMGDPACPESGGSSAPRSSLRPWRDGALRPGEALPAVSRATGIPSAGCRCHSDHAPRLLVLPECAAACVRQDDGLGASPPLTV
ncbi:hypothetical protein AAFF_G00242520 [Aldrovandia affinis]|uniref:Uncharacterized protein n=1 Tax=Aldrovandia affinis TaxID=143900 RepID=A0AAD7RDY8_9TELE|nr:hypothetical protein AAFF_G00242520 [Aldrovandia affinis]